MALPLGVWLSPGATERGLRYQQRVKMALDAVTPITAQALRQSVTDPMERFREVEARLQPRQQRGLPVARPQEIPLGAGTYLQPGETMPPMTPAESRYFEVPGPTGELPFPESELGLAQRQYEWQQGKSLTPEEIEALRPDRGGGILDTLTGLLKPAGAAYEWLTDPKRSPTEAIRSLEDVEAGYPGAGSPDRTRSRAFETQAGYALPPSHAEMEQFFDPYTRPLAKGLLETVALPYEAGEVAFEEVTGVPARGKVSGKIKGQITEDILAGFINPANIAMVSPLAMQATAGLTGAKLATQIAANLLATGMEPALIRGSLRGVTAIVARGTAALDDIPKVVRETSIVQDVVDAIRRGGAEEAQALGPRVPGGKVPKAAPLTGRGAQPQPYIGFKKGDWVAIRNPETGDISAAFQIDRMGTTGGRRYAQSGSTRFVEGDAPLIRAEANAPALPAGERPVETAGPMLERGPAEPPGPPREPPPTAQMPPEPERIPSLREVEADAFPKLTPEERARYVPEKPGIYAPDDFEEVGSRILSGADETVMRFTEKLVRIPGVKQIVGAVNRIAEARGNPVLMARIKNGIFKAIEGNRADVSVLRWKKEMLDAFSWSKDWTASIPLRPGVKGVPKRAVGHIEDLLAHTDDYVLTDVQRAALDHGRGLRDNMLRQQLSNGVDVLPVKGEYMRRIVTATPEGKVRNGVVQRGMRIGGRKGSQKPRAFEDIRDGFRAGYDYERDPFALMSTRLHEGVTTIADKRALKLVAAEGETVAERVPMQIREEAIRTRQALVQARKVASRKGASVADKTAWEVARRDYVQARKVWTEVRRRVREPGWGEVRGPGNRIFDEQFAKELTEWTTSGSESVVQQANLLVRAFKTTGDLSATGVQMGLTALTHPLVWAKGTVRGILSTLADPLTWAHANYEALDEAIKFGAAARPTEFMFAQTGLSSIPLRIPYVGSLFRGSNRAFQWAIVQAQTDLWRIHRRGLTSTADLASAAASVRKQLGTLESAALGIGSKQKALESTVAFAARFLRANTGLLTDLGMRGPRGRIARETFGRFFVAGTTLTIGFNMAMNGGKMPNLTNPHEAGWFKVRLGKDSYVSVFGPFYPFMHLVARDADLLAQGKITEVYKPLQWFIQSKAGIPFRTAADLYLASRGQETNIFGDRLPTDPAGAAEFIARQFAPIGMEQTAEGVIEGRPEAGMEMAGINVTRVSAYRHLVEGWERERGNRDVPDVPFDQAGDPFKIAEQDSVLAPLVQEVYASGRKRGTPGAERAETIETARLGLEESTGLVKAAGDIEAGVPGAKAEFAYSFEEYTTQTIGANEVVYRGMVRDPESEEDKNLQAYYEIEKTDFPDPDGPGFNLDAFYAAKDAAFAKLSPQLQKAMENDVKSANELVRRYEPEYREARLLRGELFDKPKHQGVSVEEEDEAKDLRNLVDQARDRMAGAGLEPGDVTIGQYLAVAEDNKVGAKMAYLAFALRPNSKGEVSLRDVRYTEFLIDNASKLAPYYPYLYPRRMLPALDPEIREEVIAAGVR